MAAPVFTYGSKSWAPRKQHKQRIQSAKITFLRWTKGYTLKDQIRSKEISAELNIFSVKDRKHHHSWRWMEKYTTDQEEEETWVSPEENSKDEDGTGCRPAP